MIENPKTPDIGMRAGAEHYPWPHDFIEEAECQGVSKAIPRSAIPYIKRGRTRLVIRHPKAIVYVTSEQFTLYDLAMELINEHADEPDQVVKADIVRKWIDTEEATLEDWKHAYILEFMLDTESGRNKLGIPYFLRKAERAGDLKRIEEKYGLQYASGWIGYTFLTGIQYVAKGDEDELPEDLVGTGVEMVRVEYDEEEENAEDPCRR